ncbi:hypothetical protein BZZ01_00205 [Nostocales cyanobacterium HT-58-2]|nr:hypothetical protein BZZ01_00205 [Nostocales cyanobacterium HT-58-2]
MSISSTILNNICANSSGTFWLVTYIGIIWRGFKDRSLGMPLVALSANIAWEFLFAFIYIPERQLLHYATITWLFFDIPIVLQCFLYGAYDTHSQFMKKNFRLIFIAAIAICFVILFNLIPELKDTRGVYSGYGQNLMMSILFVDMILRRDDIRGQSLYIATTKLFGTLFAFLTSSFEFFELTAGVDVPFNINEFLTAIISSQTYPMTPLIKVIYPIIFVFDALYIVLVYQKSQEKGINPWVRF